eukprot:maker-scaffold408_size180710-snap-gene-0.38 protein:Tk05210 transcript:maker-scaffold408_size180710-snap-gene-0.38-mRNA-1 annotation:"red protein (ik factor) (cytokine ik)"
MPEHDFLAPVSSGHDEPASQRMTNEDFRKLMMTPRGGSGSSVGATPVLGAGMMTPARGGATPRPAQKVSSTEKAENRKKKKSFYAKLKKEEDDQLAMLASKYRDRAKERREGGGGAEGVAAEGVAPIVPAADDIASATSGYRAVGPDFKSSFDAAEVRRQKIHESKFLGGDMEHTHLVKGLDFALLQKVRSEIATRENDDDLAEPELPPEEEPTQKSSLVPDEGTKNREPAGDPLDELQNDCRTPMAKNIVRTSFQVDQAKCNELFFPGRMAYVIDLEEDFGESDIPTTTIRSKADVEGTVSHQATLSTNDIVINKLTQILSYLRAGKSNKKKKKEKMQADKEELKEMQAQQAAANLPIYDDVGDYSTEKKNRREDRSHRDRRDRERGDHRGHRDRRERDRDRRDHRHDDQHRSDRDRQKEGGRRSYFEKKVEEEEDLGQEAKPGHKGGLTNQDRDYIRKLGERERDKVKRKTDASKGGVGLETNYEGYAECYPGLEEMNDAIDDSDDEADYSKMDLGNKKGPVGRWDFDTAEEYAEYKSKQEALPKAAFQYGVKMTEGRKTRGKVGPKNEKAKLDREWNQISALIDKRKTKSDSKKAKYE